MKDSNIDAVIFDMDGVLIDTEKYLSKFWCQAANEAGFPMTLEHAYAIRSLAGQFGKEKLQSFFGSSFDYESIRSRRKELMNEHLNLNGIEEKTGLLPCLTKLKAAGYKLAVATSTDSVRTKQYLTQIGIFHLFDNVICTNMVKKGKPEPDIYLYSCNMLKLKPSRCIAVEDSPNGVLSAYRADLKVIMIPDLTKATTLDESRVFKVVSDLNELSNILC